MRLGFEKDTLNYLKLIYLPKETPQPKTESAKTLKIPIVPKETEHNILSKLEKFESGNKFISKEMSLAVLAAQFDTNTKYLSEVINSHKNKNFNSYINELRINYIIEKLKKNPEYLNYKVSYLAEEAGFASHSSFATVFKNIAGISPNVFIRLLAKDRKNNNSNAA